LRLRKTSGLGFAKPQAAKDSTMTAPPDYLLHDAEYRRRRTRGLNGWDDGDSLQETLERVDLFLDGLPLPPSPTLIELGCGAGDISLHLAAKGFRVTGIDVAPYAVDWAREKAAALTIPATFLVADLTRELDVIPPPADVVVDGHCLHCIIGADRGTFLQNAHRCLKPGGIFHVNTMCGDPHPPWDKSFDPGTRCIITRGISQRYFGTPEGIIAELEDAGFTIVRQQMIPSQYSGDEDCLLVNAAIKT
jgi:cyclopropane fatty-acyl-phospholipid synthase-like methyltransferase